MSLIRGSCPADIKADDLRLRSQTHSGKPAFVLWALIALPTLTVLIGAIGDVVSDLVNWYTVWLGKNTIGVYRVFGLFFSKERKDKKVEKAAQKREDAQAEEDNGFHEIAAVEERSTVPVDFKMDGLSEMQAAVAEEKYKPFMMLKAMQHIVEHIDADPPRKYTFKEWSWLLKLLGEDEADEEGHRRVGMPVPDGAEVNSPLRAHQGQVWSWLGQESPLMSLEEGERYSTPIMRSNLTVGFGRQRTKVGAQKAHAFS